MIALYLTLIDDKDDKKLFEDLYDKNKSKAYAIAFSILKNKALAEEACSEAFFSLAKSFQKIKNLEPHKLDYYIVITVRNTSLNLLKKEKEQIKTMQLSEDIPELTDESLCDRNYDNIVGCIRRLSYTDQEILYLRITLGMGYNEISSALHISNAAARQRFQHAKDSLAKLLEKEGIFNG